MVSLYLYSFSCPYFTLYLSPLMVFTHHCWFCSLSWFSFWSFTLIFSMKTPKKTSKKIQKDIKTYKKMLKNIDKNRVKNTEKYRKDIEKN